jgi:hypothetical protein
VSSDDSSTRRRRPDTPDQRQERPDPFSQAPSQKVSCPRTRRKPDFLGSLTYSIFHHQRRFLPTNDRLVSPISDARRMSGRRLFPTIDRAVTIAPPRRPTDRLPNGRPGMNGRSRKKGGGTPLAAVLGHANRPARDGTSPPRSGLFFLGTGRDGSEPATSARAGGLRDSLVQSNLRLRRKARGDRSLLGLARVIYFRWMWSMWMRCDAILGWGDAWPPANSKRNQWRDDARARAAREGVGRLAASSFISQPLPCPCP